MIQNIRGLNKKSFFNAISNIQIKKLERNYRKECESKQTKR